MRRILKNISVDEPGESHRVHGKRGKKSIVCKAGCCSESSTQIGEQCSKKRFTPYQVETLKKEFAESPYISQSQAAVIARKIGLKKLQVRKWFSDYRCKIKKQAGSFEDDTSLTFVDSEKGDNLSETDSMNEFKDEKDDSESEVEEIVVLDDDYAYNPSGTRTGRKKLKKRDLKSKKSNDDTAYKKRFSPYQVEMLKKAFENSPYITQSEAAVIARNTGLKKMQVRKWFCDYRCKIKKQSLRLQRLQLLEEEKGKDGKFTKRQLSIRRLMRFHEQTKTESDKDIDTEYVPPPKNRVGRKPHKQDFAFHFTDEQLKILNEEFEKSQFITDERLNVLAERIQEKRTTIRSWFKMKRYKTKLSEQKFWTDLIEGSV